MKRIYHNDLTLERWGRFSFCEQMANIGSEVFRAMSWRQKNWEYSRLAFERALELLDLTLEAVTNSGSRLKELTRLRETLVDYFLFENTYGSNNKSWETYFGAFNYAVRNHDAKM